MSVLSELQQTLRSAIRRHRVPGASIAVYRNGRISQAAAGVINIETRVPTTPDTVFQIGSISKTFTATLIMQLVDEGLIDLDAPLRTYLPDFHVLDAQASRKVTIRQLLCHTSGIEGDLFVDSGRGDDSIARLQDMGRLLPQLFAPGERLSYCNFGFAMLGRVIELLTSQTFDTAMRERIFKPLRMTHALTLPEETLKYSCAIGHVENPKKPSEQRLSPMPWLSHGQKAAGATPSMSAADLLKFVAMHLNGGRSNDGQRIVSAAGVRMMQKQQHRLSQSVRADVNAWGLGWMLGTWSGKKVYGHDGGTVGQYSFLRVLPSKKLAVVLLTNGGDAGALFNEIFETTFAHFGKLSMPQFPGPMQRPPADMERIVGHYENLTGAITISSRKGQLSVKVTPKPGMLAGMTLTDTPAYPINRNLIGLESDNAQLARTRLAFEGEDPSAPEFVNMSMRLYRRVERP
jgi:CubicO group peptidase (beta-lactamase class C family)